MYVTNNTIFYDTRERERARKADSYKRTVIPDEFEGVKKVKRTYLPDGTVYNLPHIG
jgi:hypothetical protein